jgi:hypothetical protein
MANKVVDYFVRFLVFATFLGFFFLPDRISGALTLVTFFAVGLWAVLFPQGIILWVKTAHPDLDETNPVLWSIPRFVGAAFMLMAGTLRADFSAATLG